MSCSSKTGLREKRSRLTDEQLKSLGFRRDQKETDEDNDTTDRKTLRCQECPRQFERPCDLARHMSGHNAKKQQPTDSETFNNVRIKTYDGSLFNVPRILEAAGFEGHELRTYAWERFRNANKAEIATAEAKGEI